MSPKSTSRMFTFKGKPGPPQIEVQVEVEVDVQADPDYLPSHVDPAQLAGDIPARPTVSPSSASTTIFADMSLPRANYDPRRVCLNPFPEFTLGKHRRTVGVYLAGALFALANWTFLDAAILSAHAHAPWDEPQIPPPVHVSFVDWIPGICSLLGMIVINLIDKDRIRGEAGFGDSTAVWRARLYLFIGFALMAGGLAGSVCVHVLKYVVHEYSEQFMYYGYANISQNVALMLSAIVLWIAHNTSSEYEYNLTL